VLSSTLRPSMTQNYVFVSMQMLRPVLFSHSRTTSEFFHLTSVQQRCYMLHPKRVVVQGSSPAEAELIISARFLLSCVFLS
jgi:hypothetical protein